MRVLMLCKIAKRKAGIFLTGNLMRHSFSSVPGGRPWEFPVLGPGGSQPALPLKLCFQPGLLLCWRAGKWGFSLINRRDEVAPRRCAGSAATSVSAVEKQGASLLPREGIKSWQMLPNRKTTRRFLSSVADLAWTFFFQYVFESWLARPRGVHGISNLPFATGMDLWQQRSFRATAVPISVLVWGDAPSFGVQQPNPWLQVGAACASCSAYPGYVGTEGPCSHNWGTEGWTSGTSCKGAQKSSCSAWYHNTAVMPCILPPSPLN